MSEKYRIRLEDQSNLVDGLKKLTGAQGDKLITTLAESVGRDLIGFMKRYPPRNTTKRKKEWKSDKQRRWFFWALDRGEVNFPYRRRKSGGLSGGWNIKMITRGAVVGQRMPYGIWVQANRFQTKMHRQTGWSTEKQGIQFIHDKKIVQRHFQKLLNEAMGG